MQLNLLKTGLFLVAVTCLTSTAHASALSPELALANEPTNIISRTIAESKKVDKQKTIEVNKENKAEVINVTTHVVQPGESLTVVAEKFQTTWTRLYDKNPQITDPNIIAVNENIAIPDANEQLPVRELPKVVPPPQPTSIMTTRKSPSHSTVNITSVGRSSTAGNSYAYGYCTWYVKNRRPDLPNNLGNANTWVARAAAQGFATGSVPRAGAAGQQGMHVVYVESVNADGTVTVSEMNHVGYNIISSRTVAATYFQYIY